MDRIAKNKWQVRLAALVIFLLGAAAGALALNAYRSWSRPPGGPGGGRGGFEQALERLHLTPEQKTEVQRIFADTREQVRAARAESEPRMAEIRRQTNERLQQVLTPEQWQQFQQEMEEMRRGRRGRGRRGSPGGGR
jgi:Spy/CpxP family protein refolding chaperone